MKKINELTERFGKWFFRIKNTGVAVCKWDENSWKPW
jgi:hypothetical protein